MVTIKNHDMVNYIIVVGNIQNYSILKMETAQVPPPPIYIQNIRDTIILY